MPTRRASKQAVQNYVSSIYDLKPELLDKSVSPKLQKVGYMPAEDGSGLEESWMTLDELKDLAGHLNKDGMFDPKIVPPQGDHPRPYGHDREREAGRGLGDRLHPPDEVQRRMDDHERHLGAGLALAGSCHQRKWEHRTDPESPGVPFFIWLATRRHPYSLRDHLGKAERSLKLQSGVTLVLSQLKIKSLFLLVMLLAAPTALARDLLDAEYAELLARIYGGRPDAAASLLDSLESECAGEPFFLIARARLLLESVPEDDLDKSVAKEKGQPILETLGRVIDICDRPPGRRG